MRRTANDAFSGDSDRYRIQVRELQGYAMFVIGVKGTIFSPNAGVEQLLGFSEKDWPGQHASVIFSPSDKAVEPPTGTDRIYLVIYGTGFRGPSTVTATLPGHDFPAIYAGAQETAGLGARGARPGEHRAAAIFARRTGQRNNLIDC